MIPYQGRGAIRVARVVLALTCLAWYPFTAGARVSSSLVFLIAYAIFSVGALFETKFDAAPRSVVALVIDFAFFTFCKWLLPAEWASALVYGFLLVSTVVLHGFAAVLAVAAGAMMLIVLLTAPGEGLVWSDWSAAAMAIAFSFTALPGTGCPYSALQRDHPAQSKAPAKPSATHCGRFPRWPLQSFISFQMRLEIVQTSRPRHRSRHQRVAPVTRAVPRSGDRAAGFVRVCGQWRMACPERVARRMTEQFNDTDIAATTPPSLTIRRRPRVSLEFLQIVRETLNNVRRLQRLARVGTYARQTAGSWKCAEQWRGVP
jgi:hypothetical protein